MEIAGLTEVGKCDLCKCYICKYGPNGDCTSRCNKNFCHSDGRCVDGAIMNCHQYSPLPQFK